MVKRKSNTKWLFWIIFLILLIIAGAIGFTVWKNYFEDNKIGNGGTDEELEVVKGLEIMEEEVKKERVEQFEGEDPNTLEELTGVVTYAGVMDDKLVIRINIDQYLSSGRCKLVMEREGEEVYTDMAGLTDSASTSTCMGFDVLLSRLDGGGDFNIIVEVESSGKKGTITAEVSL